MDVAIVGGGIGGLAAAAFLQTAGISATVYEQAPALLEVGAGIVLAPNAVRLLRRLDLFHGLRERAVRVETGWEFRRWEDGRVLSAQDMSQCEELYGEAAWLIHRADLLDLLLSAVDPNSIRLDHQLANAETDGASATLWFKDRDVLRADVLIAADGIHSTLRARLTGATAPRDLRLCAWRALVPAADAPHYARRPVQSLWIGPGRHLVHYPVSAGKKINIVAFTPVTGHSVESWTAEGDPRDFAAEFAGWDPRLRTLLDSVKRVGRWSVLDREPIDNYVYGRIALLGDAAHPMLPFFAQGAGQAIEDAATIATCLSARHADIDTALRVYSDVRVPRTAQVQDASYQRATANHLDDGPEQAARDRSLQSQDPLLHSRWLYAYDAELDAAAVLDLLHQ